MMSKKWSAQQDCECFRRTVPNAHSRAVAFESRSTRLATTFTKFIYASLIIPLEISSGDDVFCGLCW
jgi:hypothetical protein